MGRLYLSHGKVVVIPANAGIQDPNVISPQWVWPSKHTLDPRFRGGDGHFLTGEKSTDIGR
jgi:hypothetical protein